MWPVSRRRARSLWGGCATRRPSRPAVRSGGNLLDQALWLGRRRPAWTDHRRTSGSGLLPFDHDRQLVSAAPPGRGRRDRARHEGSARGGAAPVRGRARGGDVDRGSPVRGGRPGGGRRNTGGGRRRRSRLPRTSAICTSPGSSPSPTRPRPTPASRSPSSRRSTSRSRSSPATTARSRPRCAATSGSSRDAC